MPFSPNRLTYERQRQRQRHLRQLIIIRLSRRLDGRLQLRLLRRRQTQQRSAGRLQRRLLRGRHGRGCRRRYAQVCQGAVAQGGWLLLVRRGWHGFGQSSAEEVGCGSLFSCSTASQSSDRRRQQARQAPAAKHACHCVQSVGDGIARLASHRHSALSKRAGGVCYASAHACRVRCRVRGGAGGSARDRWM